MLVMTITVGIIKEHLYREVNAIRVFFPLDNGKTMKCVRAFVWICKFIINLYKVKKMYVCWSKNVC